MTTDTAWEEWGRRDPYFGVITDRKYRMTDIDEAARKAFFSSGEHHVHWVLSTIRRHIDPGFTPRSAVDFGCGVGRVLMPLAKIVPDIVGLDVSPSMLLEARRNCDNQELYNVRLFESNDDLSPLSGTFDLVHSCIVFQHIPPERGRALFAALLQRIGEGGVGAIQLTYSKAGYESTRGLAPAPALQAAISSPNTSQDPDADPPMQMNPYNLNEILFLLQRRGILRFHAEYTDHGGELGVFLFFQLP